MDAGTITLEARQGVPEKVAVAISGHKTRFSFDRYNIVSVGLDLGHPEEHIAPHSEAVGAAQDRETHG